MRVSNDSVYNSIKINLAKATEDMVKANNVVSSGKRINKLSDDPVGLVNVLNMRSSMANVQQLERNISMGKAWLQAGETALTQVHEILSDVKALCVEMANDSKGASERANAAVEVDGQLRQILALANTQVGGRYIFAGTNTSTTPFRFDDEDSPSQVFYDGNDTAFSIRIGRGIEVEVGRDGEEVFGDNNFDWSDPDAGSNNIFKTLMDLKSALQNNDRAGIQGAMDKLDMHMELVSNAISDIGIKVSQLEVKDNIIQDLKLNYQSRMSEIEDADIAEAIMDLTAKQTAYKAALASSSKVMQLSLVDYL